MSSLLLCCWLKDIEISTLELCLLGVFLNKKLVNNFLATICLIFKKMMAFHLAK
jgi:hypothetical protein